MKQIFATLALFGLLAASPVFGQGGNAKLLTGETCLHFIPDGGNTLNYADSTAYKYDGERRLIEQNIWYGGNVGAWQFTDRLVDYVYDSNGNGLSYLYQQSANSVDWEDYLRVTRTFDAESHQLSNTVETWEDTAWVFSNAQYWTYDANGNVLTKTFDSGNRILYAYNGQGLLTSETSQSESNGTWLNEQRKVYSYTPQSGLNPSWRTEQYWTGSLWLDSQKQTYTYDANGDRTKILGEIWYTVGWTNSSEFTAVYDADRNEIFWLLKFWENSAWKNVYQGHNTYDDESNLLSDKLERWFTSYWATESFCQYYYTNFVSSHSPLPTAFELFPNPASTSVTLKREGSNYAMIYDQHGRVVHSQSLQDQETMQLGNLPSGNYLLQVLGKDGKMGAKPLQIKR